MDAFDLRGLFIKNQQDSIKNILHHMILHFTSEATRWLQEKIGKPLTNAVYQKLLEMPKVPHTQAHLRRTNASVKVSFALVPVFFF